MHKVFISFHHDNDQCYKEELVRWGSVNEIFIDGSVELGEIPDDWEPQQIREYIRETNISRIRLLRFFWSVLKQKTGNMSTGNCTQVCTTERRTRSLASW